jgi:micrococcal nuclease
MLRLPPTLLCIILLAAAPSGAAPLYGPYQAAITRIVDGDTLEADLFVYPSLKVTTLVRLKGIDTPELRGPTACERTLAQRAREYLATLALGPAQVNDVRPDKYGGRIDGRVTAKGVDVVTAMIAAGHGRPYTGGRREPWCR